MLGNQHSTGEMTKMAMFAQNKVVQLFIIHTHADLIVLLCASLKMVIITGTIQLPCLSELI